MKNATAVKMTELEAKAVAGDDQARVGDDGSLYYASGAKVENLSTHSITYGSEAKKKATTVSSLEIKASKKLASLNKKLDKYIKIRHITRRMFDNLKGNRKLWKEICKQASAVENSDFGDWTC